MPQPPTTLNNFNSLIQVIRDLRGPEGCPWDKEQTHQSLTAYAIEEVHEMAEAIESGVDEHMCEELGDVLFQVVLHARLAEERKAFNITDVVESIVSKIVRRHPHVFSNTQVKDTDEVIKNWEEIKKQEKKNKKTSVFDIPKSLPALQRSHKIGEKTEKYKFDWNTAAQVLAQLKAEIVELEDALKEPLSADKQQHLEHEMGDVLFSAAQLARHLKIEPETSLRLANSRFSIRFEKMLELTNGLETFVALSADQKEKLWQEAKLKT